MDLSVDISAHRGRSPLIVYVMTTRAIIFDLDDTLIDTSSIFHELRVEFLSLMVEEGFDQDKILPAYEVMDAKNLKRFGYASERNLLSMRETYELLAVREQRAFSASVLKQISDIGGHCLYRIPQPMEYMLPLLRFCEPRYQLALMTRGSLALQSAKLETLDLHRFFSLVEVVPEKNVGKFLSLADRLQGEPREILSVGDSLRFDILPARLAGMNAMHVSYPLTDRQWSHDWAPEADLLPYGYIKTTSLRGVQDHLEAMANI